jgi:hypothetical protein
MLRRLLPLLIFIILLGVIASLANLGPPERTLGANVRLVYLHGAWVWTALLSFLAAALVGLFGLAAPRKGAQRWSIALGQAGTLFWVTYLLLSMWAMQANWNGLFLAEPRWRISVDFAVVAMLLQTAILTFDRPDWGAVLNIAFLAALAISLSRADQVMHPASPILSSGSLTLRVFFAGLLAICALAAWQLARWLHAHAS